LLGSPQELGSIRYEDMRQILIDYYGEKKIGKLVEEKQEDGTVKVYPYKRNLKVLDEFFAGMRLDQNGHGCIPCVSKKAP
jgi:hypothetical protein